MRFGLDGDQREFAGAVRKLLETRCPPAAVRAAWDGPPDRELWATLDGMGVTDPELDLVTKAAVAVECGRAALPHPFVETAFVAAWVVGPTEGRLWATDMGGTGIVPSALDADAFVIGGAPYERDEVRIEPVATIDGSRRAGRVTPIHPEPEWTDEGEVPLAGMLGTAAFLVGLGQQMLAMTVDYVGSRQQFGVPIGSFQAVKHHLADVAKDLAFALPVVLRAADTLERRDPAAERDVAMAKAMANEAAALAADRALQCHGAIGYTVEADLHLFLKRTWALTRTWGSTAQHRRTVAAAIGLGVTPPTGTG
jgi:hypothetical protein